jgi:large subunit ribosomal protein L15
MKLNELAPPKGARKSRKRVGRGPGSGSGSTSGRGSKGQKARAGGTVRPGYEGGQMPLQRRLPKRGFTNIFKKVYAIVNLRDLARFEKGSVIDEKALMAVGLIKGRNDGIKLLGQGGIDFPLVVKVNSCSKKARAGIEAAGGQIELV